MSDPVLDALLHHERFLITTHVRPDGDAIGSQLALGMVLRKMGKAVAMINSDPVPDNLAWLPGVEEVQTFDKSLAQLEQIAAAEVIVVVDTNGLERIGKLARPVKSSTALKLLIDHHTEPETWFDHICARDTASSTGELVYELIAAHEADLIDEDIATALYAAILTDTGSFRYNSVTPAVHRIVADLMERGNLEPETLYSALYETKTPEGLRLLGRVLDTLTLKYDGVLAYVVVSTRMLQETGASSEETEGFVSYVMSLGTVRVALIFTETAKGTKVSFRSKGDLHVNGWARAFGGGGHRNASGAYVRRPLGEVIQSVVEAAPKYVDLEEPEPKSNGTLSPEDAALLAKMMQERK